MKVYTRTGDSGKTSLFNGARVAKDHALVDAYGTIDECNAAVGLANSHLQLTSSPSTLSAPDENKRKFLQSKLEATQNFLFDLGAHLATPRPTSPNQKIQKTAFPAQAVTDLEKWIDEMDEDLPTITTFILPGGHPAASALHLARTIARRAERNVTPLYMDEKNEIDECAYRFINRLSDFFFVASRYANKIMGVSDVFWRKSNTS